MTKPRVTTTLPSPIEAIQGYLHDAVRNAERQTNGGKVLLSVYQRGYLHALRAAEHVVSQCELEKRQEIAL